LYNLKSTIAQLEQQCETYKNELSISKLEYESIAKQFQSSEAMALELKEKTELIGQLRHDIVQLQSHLSEAMRMLRKGTGEDSVDRRLVANLVVGLMTAPYGDRKRYEILELIASILKLDNAQKVKVGLRRSEGRGSATSPANPSPVGHGEVLLNLTRILWICG
jgi:chromosome segregation ATPase